MVIAEFQVGLALKGFASKLTVPNYRVKWGADFSPPKWMFCPKANAKHAQIWIFLRSNSLLGIHLSQQLKKFKIFYHLQSLLEAFMESICPKIGGLTVLLKQWIPFCLKQRSAVPSPGGYFLCAVATGYTGGKISGNSADSAIFLQVFGRYYITPEQG